MKNYEERMQLLFSKLKDQSQLSTKEVSKLLTLSESSTRRLFIDLANEGKIIRVFGGIQLPPTNMIAIILNDLESIVYVNMVKKISIELSKYNYTTFICDSHFDLEIERKTIAAVLSRSPESIIISPVSSTSDNIYLLKDVMDKTIILDNPINNMNANYVYVNHERSGYISASYMLQSGHERNIVLSSPDEFPGSSLFIKGIKQAYSDANVDFDDSLVYHTIPSITASHNIISKYLKENYHNETTRATGVVSFCDSMAYGVYSAVKEFGLRIPDDISVIGYDDNPMDCFTAPELTTIHLPKERVSSLCAELLISKLVKGNSSINAISIEPHLVERDSVKKIGKAAESLA